MSLETHLQELRKKHEALDIQIAEEEKLPGMDHLQIQDLKKQKLRLKEEIARSMREYN
ncbi:MAG: YdcH family protein [Pseudomonadota bacterium]